MHGLPDKMQQARLKSLDKNLGNKDAAQLADSKREGTYVKQIVLAEG